MAGIASYVSHVNLETLTFKVEILRGASPDLRSVDVSIHPS
jgi:hypothetical protein